MERPEPAGNTGKSLGRSNRLGDRLPAGPGPQALPPPIGDLAKRVEDVSHDLSLGYDIASFTHKGRPKPIEVKAAAKRGADCRFFLSENERIKALALPDYHFVLVFDVKSKKPVICEFRGKSLPSKVLHPVQYEVRLRNTIGSTSRKPSSPH